MKKLLLITLLAITFLYTGCQQTPKETYGTIPTLPSFPTERSPYEILSDALTKTKSAEHLQLEYNRNGEVTRVSGSPADALAPAMNYVSNPEFLRDFCALPIRAIPSNTGTIRYELTDLTADQLSALLGIQITAEDDCSVALEMDGTGCLTRFEYTAGTETGSICIVEVAE